MLQPETSQPQFIEPVKPWYKRPLVIGISVGVLIVAALVAWVAFKWLNPKDATLDVSMPDNVLAGVPFPLTVAVSNGSNVTLKDVQAVINLPPQFVFVGPGQKTFDKSSLGDLEVGQVAKEDFQVVSMGNQNTVQQFSVSISYVPGAFRSRFEKKADKTVTVGDDGVALDVAPPKQVFAGEPFDIVIPYQNISTSLVGSATLHIVYPNGFTFSSADVAPVAGGANNEWDLGDIGPGAQGEIHLTGSLSGQTGAVFDFKFALTAGPSGEAYTVTEKTVGVSIASSPLSLSISRGDVPEVIAPGDYLTYYLEYANNTQIGLKDVIITAKLSGEMFDLIRFKSQGVLGANNTVTWNTSRVPELSSLAPSQRGQVSFTIPVKADYPIKRLSSKNFTLRVDGQIESPTVPRGVASNKTIGVAVLENKIRGKLAVDTAAYFHDAASGILNQGSVPPKVGQTTQYTVHWTLKNFATDVDNVVVHAFLGPNVRFTGQSKTNIASSTPPTYEERTQQVTWNVGKVAANRGILSPAYEAIFQIELTPSIDQTESSPTLVGQATVEYYDVFTGENRVGSDYEVTTQLPDDKSIGPDGGRIKQ